MEADFRLVPVLSSFYGEGNFYNIKSEQKNGLIRTTQRQNHFRTAYSLRAYISTKSGKHLFGVGVRYSRSTNNRGRVYHPDSLFSMLMTENLVADYIGGNFRMLFNPLKSNKLRFGFTIGSGMLSGRNKTISLAHESEEIDPNGVSKTRKYLSEDVSDYNLGYQVKLYDLYLNGTFQYHLKIGKKTTLFTGIELPLLRLFFFNSQTRLGLSLNNESFFTSYESYVPSIGDQVSANKNFAFSLKKTNSLSLNFGICYTLN
ncbi:hypothetical protein CW751_01330 [Brumimicrobium salinarum]|uniref:Outer membrane protein beta-barrel domain-containing protein n=1 Tax=Brumimicrobium salinarum TaxID=2058658 RepID=A0A2I0R5Z7_9FLAO|nr:hypothetical protein CW751_01330 [Brumimicrobium salinarum]